MPIRWGLPAATGDNWRNTMRPILAAVALAAAVVVAGCGIVESVDGPAVPAPTPGPNELPSQLVRVGGTNGNSDLTLRIYDRSFALVGARSATAAELADSESVRDRVIASAGFADGRRILVMWPGTDCLETGDLFIAAGVNEVFIVPRAPEGCRPDSNVRGVVLEFKLAVDLERIVFDLRPAV
jgi:hypothetical protein